MAKRKQAHEYTDEQLLDSIVESINEIEPVLLESELKSGKELFIEKYVVQKFRSIMEGYDLSQLSPKEAASIFEKGFSAGNAGQKNPYPAGHTLAKIWDAGAAAGREVDAAWTKNQQNKSDSAISQVASPMKQAPVAKPAQAAKQPVDNALRL